jgi:arylsulfatase A-like enzyme
MAALDELKLADNTLLIFASDNGGLLPVTSNLGIRAGKGSAYEGGVRTPLIVRWPGKISAGTTCDVPVITADYYPTILAAAGLSDDPQHHPDGENLLPLLRQSGQLARDAIYWHYPHYHPGGATPYSAIREGDRKLIEFFEDGHVELYDLKADPREQHNLAKESPQEAQRLRAKLAAWRSDVGAQVPTVNPSFDPAKDAAGAATSRPATRRAATTRAGAAPLLPTRWAELDPQQED